MRLGALFDLTFDANPKAASNLEALLFDLGASMESGRVTESRVPVSTWVKADAKPDSGGRKKALRLRSIQSESERFLHDSSTRDWKKDKASWLPH